MNFTVFTEYRTDYNIYIHIYICISIIKCDDVRRDVVDVVFNCIVWSDTSLFISISLCLCLSCLCLSVSVCLCLSVYPSLTVCLSLSRLVRSLALYIYIFIYGGGLCAGVWLQCTISYAISKRMIWIKFPSTCISWEIMLGWCRRKSRWYIYTDFSNGLVPSDQVNYNSAAPLFHRASCIYVFHRCSNNISKKNPTLTTPGCVLMCYQRNYLLILSQTSTVLPLKFGYG